MSKNFDDLMNMETAAPANDAAIQDVITKPTGNATMDSVAGLKVEHVGDTIVMPKQITAKEVSALIGLSYRTTTQYMKAGRIKARKHGKEWVTTADAINAYLKGDC